ncbi:hypothetical protein BDF21DRAFT_410454 [Thamnidium elegans]|nr:hypothetical protein BDF21DRAFT_410454 [Thamnidium elegans]
MTKDNTISDLPVDHVYTDHVHPWEEIVKYVSLNQVSKLRRNKDQQAVYAKWVKETKEEYGSVENYLKETKIQYPEGVTFLVLPNDFPYSVDPGIDHILIWSKTPIDSELVSEILEERYGSNNWEWTYFVNPPQWQSVPSLPHTHIFLRRRPA